MPLKIGFECYRIGSFIMIWTLMQDMISNHKLNVLQTSVII